MSVLKIDIDGLDLALGGGVHLIERIPGCGQSATILIRGPAGSGKTVFGTQLAASIARALKTDVAYGCVELLPTELRAQHENIRRVNSREQVIFLTDHPAANEPDASHVRIYTAVLDLGEEGESVKRLGGELELLLEAATERASRKVGVLVIDSLSTGYGLGANAPRVLADGVCKLAATKGLVVVLLEEMAEEMPSVWSFAVDTVFELKLLPGNKRTARQLLIPKNRLGPSTPGPHEFDFAFQDGIYFLPSESAYLRSWVHLKLEPPSKVHNPQWWPEPLAQISWLPPFASCVTAVIGEDTTQIKHMAFEIGRAQTAGDDLFFLIGAQGYLGLESFAKGGHRPTAYAWDLNLSSGPTTLAVMRSWLEALRRPQGQLFRVFIGDLRDLHSHPNSSSAQVTISAMAALLRLMGIPLILFETMNQNVPPLSASMANVLVTVRKKRPDAGVHVTNIFGAKATVDRW